MTREGPSLIRPLRWKRRVSDITRLNREPSRATREHRLGLAERHLSFARRRSGLEERRQGPARTPRARVPGLPARTRAVSQWASVVHTYQQALGVAPAAAGAVAAADATVPVVTVDPSTVTAYEGGQPGLYTISGTNVYQAISFQIQGTGADTSFDDALISFDLLTLKNISAITLTSGAGGVMLGSVSIPSGQSSVGLKLVAGDDSPGGEGSASEQDLLTILPPPSGCCCGGGGYTPNPSQNTATITLSDVDVDVDVTIQGPLNAAHASEGPPAITQDFTISRTGDLSAALPVVLDTTGTTAAALYNGQALVAGATTVGVTIPAGAASVSLTITPQDPVDSGATGSSQVVTLTIQGGSCCGYGEGGPGYGVESPNSASMTIDDPDGGTPTVTATASPATAVENGQDGIIDVHRNGDDGTLKASFTLAPVNGAVADTDYTLSAVNSTATSFDPQTGYVTFGDGTTDILLHVAAKDKPGGESTGKGMTLSLVNPPSSSCCCCGVGPSYFPVSPSTATITLGDAPLTNLAGVNVTAVAGVPFTGVVAQFKDSDPLGIASDTGDQITWGNGDAATVGTIAADPVDPTLLDVSVTNKTFAAAGHVTGMANLIHAGLSFPVNFLINVVATQLQSVAWVAQPGSPLDGNPGPGGGQRIYPDRDPGSTTARNLVSVQAKLSTAVAGVTVYFNVIDVDDPSANLQTDPNGIVDNEGNSRDNRGDGSSGLGSRSYFSGTTDLLGQVMVSNFQVSMQPGDNYRVVASLKPINNGSYTAIQNDGLSAGINDNTVSPSVRLVSDANASTVMSGMLTVWRRLHVETDSMGPVSGNTVTGTILRATIDPVSGTMTIETDQPVAANDFGRFVPGTLTINGVRYRVVGQLVASSGFIKVVVSLVDPNNTVAPAITTPFSLVDDDLLHDGQTLPMPDTSTLVGAMVYAYVTVLVNEPGVGISENNVPFAVNLEAATDVYSVVNAHWNSRGKNANDFWVAYVLAGFQGPRENDGDPENERVILGQTLIPSTTVPHPGGSVVYAESVHDGSVGADSFDEVVIHEVGHAVANSTSEPVTGDLLTLGDPDDPANGHPDMYLLFYINAIRKAAKPWS